MSKLALFFVITCAGLASSQPTPESRILQEVASALSAKISVVWPNIQSIWPKVSFSNLKFVLMTEQGNEALELGPQTTRALTRAEMDKLGPARYSPVHSPDGKTVIVWSINPEFRPNETLSSLTNYIFEQITSLAFRELAQRNWPSVDLSSHLPVYPLELGPRLLRYFTYLELYTAYTATSSAQRVDHLSAAAFWHKRWQREYPSEVRTYHDADTRPSTWIYVGLIARLRSEHGFTANLRPYILGELTLELEKFALLDRLEASTSLGFLAGLLADELRLNWKQEVAQGKTPLDALFSKIEARAQPEPQSARTKLTNALAVQTRRLALQLDPFIKRYSDPRTTLLVVPAQTVTSRGFHEEDILLKPLNLPTITNLWAGFSLHGGGLEVEDLSAGVGPVKGCQTPETTPGDNPNPAEEPLLYTFPLQASEFKLSDNRLTIKLEHMRGSFDVRAIKLQNRQLLCALPR